MFEILLAGFTGSLFSYYVAMSMGSCLTEVSGSIKANEARELHFKLDQILNVVNKCSCDGKISSKSDTNNTQKVLDRLDTYHRVIPFNSY